jgi:argininosuccinate lyase
VEKELIKRVGKLAGKMHTARSRNDQVALDLRLYSRNEICVIKQLLCGLENAIVGQAQKNINAVMPGYTHLQPAQPVLFSHYILAYAWMFERDIERLADCEKRINVLPLGSAALAGTSFPIDRNYTAKLLGFGSISPNSMDAVSDRDFVAEILSCLSIISLHLSRLCEELITWSSAEFGFVNIASEFTSGSSIMPQKRNPDVAEIIRGKTGRVYGSLMSILTIMKGLPLAYNRDMQEDKPPLFDAIDTVKGNLTVIAPMIETLKINEANMLKATVKGYLSATELADYLARRGMDFRSAHGLVKDIVGYCARNKKTLDEPTIAELKSFSEAFSNDIIAMLKPERIVQNKVSEGGTSAASVNKQIKKLKNLLKGRK